MSRQYEEFCRFLSQGKFSEAIHLAEEEVLRSGDKSEFWLTQLSIALRLAGRIKEATQAAEKALTLAPQNNWALLALAETFLARLDFTKALSLFEEALRGQPPVLKRAERGVFQCLLNLKRVEELLERVLRSELPEEETLSWQVASLIGLDKIDDAYAACQRWLALSPNNPAALWEFTKLEVLKVGREAVIGRLARMIKIPSTPSVYSEIYASLCRQAGEGEKVLATYAKLSAKDSRPRILRQQAFALAKTGREDEAIPRMEELLRLDPKDFYLHSAYLAACKRKEIHPRAAQFYRELLELHPSEKKLYGYLRRATTREVIHDEGLHQR